MVTGGGESFSLFRSRSYRAASLSKNFDARLFSEKSGFDSPPLRHTAIKNSSVPLGKSPQCFPRSRPTPPLAVCYSSRFASSPRCALSPKKQNKNKNKKTNKLSFWGDIRWPKTLKRRLFREMEASVGVFPSLGANFEVIFSGSPQALSVSRRRAWLRVCGGLRCV